MITVTDGSYDPANNRAGWGFVAYQDDVKLAEALGSHIVYISSTRMELEAIRQALLSLYETLPNCISITIATVLTRIRNGWLTDGWHMNDSEGVCCRITFMYDPGHAGVAINETADTLASF